MYNRRRGLHPVVFILILAVVCVAATALVLFLIGYRYITNDESYKFFGKVSDGQPVYGTIRYPDGGSAQLDYYARTITYSNGDIYVGEITQLYRHGKGSMSYYTTKDKYEGAFSYDKLTGTGTYTFRNGDVYTGDLVDSKKEGHGVYQWADGSTYDGEFSGGLANGYGIFTLNPSLGTSSARYEGYFKNGVKDGEGEFYFANGDYYKGTFSNDKRTGKGFYRWANKETYTGNFIDNMLDTRLKDANGEFIVNEDGSYKHGDPGVYTWPSGRTYTGYFEEGSIVTVGANNGG